MEFQVWGLVSLVCFYISIVLVGIIASRKVKKEEDIDCDNISISEDVMLAGRDLGIAIGMFSMTATWVDGGYISGAAESVFRDGVLWCQGPIGYSMALIIAGRFYATKMHDAGYVTMMDPFQRKYGKWSALYMYLPSACGDIFCNGAILSSLGATVSAIVGLDVTISIIVSGIIATMYTLAGGMYSVTYTDVMELSLLFCGVWLCIPFCLINKLQVGDLSSTEYWGVIETKDIGRYVDGFLLLMMGGVPWQTYFQRVLSSRSARTARIISYIGGCWCALLAIGPILIGIIAKAAIWQNTNLNHTPTSDREISMVLPLSLLSLTPSAVAFIGMGAISAGVMSSADACILSSSSQLSRNIFHYIFRPQATEREIVWVMRIGMIVFGAIATAIALTVQTIYGLWYLAADLIYVILFPQLTCVLYFESHSNICGSLAAFVVSIVLRFLGGEPVIHLPAILKFPYYDEEEHQQLFPFKTLITIISFITLLSVSKMATEIQKRLPSTSSTTNLANKTYDGPRSVPMSVISAYENELRSNA